MEGEVCGKVGWWKPTPYQALRLVCTLAPHSDAVHSCQMPDLLSVGQLVTVSWVELSSREPE
jgi:hypothetical protein